MNDKLNHRSFPQPSDGHQKVWRYMSLAKFINLAMTKSLYLTRIDFLGDGHEGSYTKPHFNSRTYEFFDKKGNKETLFERRQRLRKTMFVNCWRLDNFESEAMWQLYCSNNEGLAIQTTYQKLVDSVIDQKDVYIGLIKYLDYETESFRDENILNPIMHKRKAFEHEKEIRIVQVESDPWNDSSLEITKPGTSLEWRLTETIESISINPYAQEWYFETVKTLLVELKLDFNIKWSSIKSNPYY